MFMGILGIDRTNCLSREKSKRYINIQYFLYENERLDRIAATTSISHRITMAYITTSRDSSVETFSIIHPVFLYP